MQFALTLHSYKVHSVKPVKSIDVPVVAVAVLIHVPDEAAL